MTIHTMNVDTMNVENNLEFSSRVPGAAARGQIIITNLFTLGHDRVNGLDVDFADRITLASPGSMNGKSESARTAPGTIDGKLKCTGATSVTVGGQLESSGTTSVTAEGNLNLQVLRLQLLIRNLNRQEISTGTAGGEPKSTGSTPVTAGKMPKSAAEHLSPQALPLVHQY